MNAYFVWQAVVKQPLIFLSDRKFIRGRVIYLQMPFVFVPRGAQAIFNSLS